MRIAVSLTAKNSKGLLRSGEILVSNLIERVPFLRVGVRHTPMGSSQCDGRGGAQPVLAEETESMQLLGPNTSKYKVVQTRNVGRNYECKSLS